MTEAATHTPSGPASEVRQMAKKVRGHRANKPNDSFGTVNQDSLYKGKYREEVYKDDDEDSSEERQASEEETEEVAEKAADSSNGFAPDEAPEETPEEPEFKKRYDDLKRHYDEKLTEWKTEKEDLINRLRTPSPQSSEPETDLESFRVQHPDVYQAIHQISSSQSEARVKDLEEELQVIKQREQNLEKDRAYQELLRLQPDFEELKSSDAFREWLKLQPTSISDGVYNNATDAHWASRVVDLYKSDNGLKKKSSTKATKKSDAAMSVSKTASKEVSRSNDGGKIWKASEIGKMKPWEFEKMEQELDAARIEGRIDFNS